MQPTASIRVLGKIAIFVVCLLALSACAQESDSLGDVARHSRAQRENEANGHGASILQCTVGPVSRGQILAWQIIGVPAADIATNISSRGITFIPGTGVVPLNAFTPPISGTVGRTPNPRSETAESDTFLLNLLQAMESSKQNDYGKAIHAMQAVIKENRTSVDVFSALGSVYLRSRDLANATNAYRQAAQLVDSCVYAHRQLASIYYSLEDVEKAQAEAQKMLALDPSSAEARKYTTRAHALKIDAEHQDTPSGDDVDSSEYETDTHERVSNEALQYNRAGIAKYQQGNATGAIQDYQQAIKAEPRWWGPRYNLGLAYSHSGKLQEAVEAYRGAKSLSPDHLIIRQNLGYCLCKLGRWNEAVAEFEELLKIDPTWNMARPCLYQSLKALHRDREAEQVLSDEKQYKEQGYDD